MCWSRKLVISVLMLTLLAACGGDDAAPTATSPQTGQPLPTVTNAPTATPQPTVTVAPTNPTPEPTASPFPTTTPTTPTDPAVYHDILFSTLIDGGEVSADIFSVDADGSDLQPLTSEPDDYYEAFPSISPDGTRVAVTRANDRDVGQIVVIDLDTREEWLILDGIADDLTWSPDSSRLAFSWIVGGRYTCCYARNPNEFPSRLVTINPDGTDLLVLSEETYDESTDTWTSDGAPQWSPDGAQILFGRTRGSETSLAVINADGSGMQELDTPRFHRLQASWSPDGSSIAFVPESPRLLFTIAPDGSSLRQLTEHDLDVGAIAFTADGSQIVFVGSAPITSGPRPGDSAMFVVHLDSGAIAALTEPDLIVETFWLSPDTTKIVFDTRETSTNMGALYVMDTDGSGLQELRVRRAGYPGLAWSPDGTHVAVLTDSGFWLELKVIDTTTASISQVLARTIQNEVTRGPYWRPAPVSPPVVEHGWSDDTLQAVVPGVSSGAYPNPQLDYPWVVWNNDMYGSAGEPLGRSIVARHLETGEEIQIASGSEIGWQFAVDDGVVVWLDGGMTLHATSLVTGNDLTTAVREAWVPRISGRWVVWTQPSADDRTELMVWDIWTSAKPVSVATSTGSFCSSYEVSGDYVAWVECFQDPFGARLSVRDIVTGETVRTIEHDGVIYPLDLHGSTLVRVLPARDWFSGDPATIVVEDLETGRTHELQAHVNTHEGGYRIATDGRFIVFEGRPSGYDLVQGVWFDLPVDGHSVALEDGRLLWAIDRSVADGQTEIHLAPAAEFSSGQRSRYFAETDSWLALGFLRFWEANGGLPVFGYPFGNDGWTDVGWDNPLHLRWTERQRLEWHPENAGTVYEIQLGRLGAELLDQQGHDWRAFPTADPTSPHYFAVTGHAIAPEFWDYWSDHGLDLGDRGVSFRESVALFGYPLSEPMVETNADGHTVLTQYFERAVFEYHPDNPAEWRVLLRRLGAEVLAKTE